VPITGGKLDLGTWQRIFYAEFDGQRDKRVIGSPLFRVVADDIQFLEALDDAETSLARYPSRP
jgi:hypothetical protein